MMECTEGEAKVATTGHQNTVFGGFESFPQTGFVGWLLDAMRWWRQRELRGRRQQARRQLTIVETLPLGPRKELVLVTCAGERFLVGTGAEGVQIVVRVGVDRVFGVPEQKLTADRRWE